MKQNPLFVPVTLDVLLMGKPGVEQLLADFTPKYDILDETNLLGDQITNPAFSSRQGLPGAHLHWTMPDALLHGTQAESGEVVFPELPNRWLVMRLRAGDGCMLRKAWLVQSDTVTFTKRRTEEGMYKTAIPYLCYEEGQKLWKPAGKDGAYYAFLGEAAQVGGGEPEVPGEGEPLSRLTAVGMGDHLFSAFYPLCQTVFGFYDPLEDGDEGDYTYLVCGYYSKDESDPFCGTDPELTAQGFGWTWEDKGGAPDSILCHGASCGVHWQGRDHSYIDHKGLPLELVLANTSSEALACYLQNQMAEVQGAERMLNALMSGLLEEFDRSVQSDPLIQLEEGLHERQFAHSPGGETWQLSTANAQSHPLLGEEDEQAVRSLQELADQRNTAHQRMLSYGEEAFYYWNRYIKRVTSPFSPTGAEEERQRLEEALNGFETEAKQKADYAAQMAAQAETVQKRLRSKQAELKCVPESSFSRPNPPVILMAEQGADRVRRQGFQRDAAGMLPCRLQAVHSLDIDLPEGTITLGAEELAPLWETFPDSIPAPVRELCVETVLLGTSFARLLAGAALEKAGEKNPAPRLNETVDRILAAQAAAKGRPFDLSLREWDMPWNPILMEWQMKLTPARAGSVDDTFAAFALGDIDLEASNTSFAGKEIVISGQTLLTPHAPLLLKRLLQQLAADYGEGSTEYQELNALAQRLEDRQILSQQLTGFEEALLGLRTAPTLPPLPVPNREMDALAARMQPVMDHITPAVPTDVDRSNYLPLRGGTMRLDQLRLVDTFGQFRVVNVPDYHMSVSEALRCDKPLEALLPPRFPGGMRLSWRWVAAEETKTRSLSGISSPVCGFLMVNVFDHSLQVHDADGSFLGWLHRSDEGIRWRSAPGAALTPEDIPGQQFRLFVQGALGWGLERFEALLIQADRHACRPGGTEGAENPLLRMENMFALVRAAFSVEEEGLRKKFWGGSAPDTGGYETQPFPLRLGDERRSQEGLIGFFVDEDGEETYRTLHLPSGTDGTLTLTLEHSARTVSLLLDPYREVTVRTGFLPAFHARLSPELYTAQSERMRPFLDLWPVLSPAEELILPVVEAGGQNLTVTQVGRDGATTVQTLREGLSPLFPGARPHIMEGYLSWQKGE